MFCTIHVSIILFLHQIISLFRLLLGLQRCCRTTPRRRASKMWEEQATITVQNVINGQIKNTFTFLCVQISVVSYSSYFTSLSTVLFVIRPRRRKH